MSEFVDSAVPKPAVPGHAPMHRPEPTEETFTNNQFGFRPVSGGGKQEVFTDKKAAEPTLPEGIIARLDAAEKRGILPPKEPPTALITEAKPVVPVEEAPKDAPPAEAPPADEPLRAENIRLVAANRALLADLEKKTPPASPHKLLLEAADGYFEDSKLSLRKLVAHSLGIEDPADKRVTDEIKDLYTDLTADELGVTPDTAHLAKRESARTRNLLEREKRERKAQETQTASSAESQKAAEASTFIGNRIQSKGSDGKALAEGFPLLMKFAERLDGMKPADLIWQVLQRETKTGRIPLSGDDAKDIQAAAQFIETHYQDLADQFGKARPPSTAQPNPPKASSPSPEASQEKAARTLTTADASVAPATSPAPKTETTQDKRVSIKDRNKHLEYALRRLPK